MQSYFCVLRNCRARRQDKKVYYMNLIYVSGSGESLKLWSLNVLVVEILFHICFSEAFINMHSTQSLPTS